MASSWSLCLVCSLSSSPSKSKGTKNGSSNSIRKVVKVNPSTDSLADLHRIAEEAFGATVEALKAGFPAPQVLDSSDTTKLMESKKVGNQERINVVLSESKAGQKSVAKNAKKIASSTNVEDSAAKSLTTSRRPKRAAAQAASDSFAGVIKQQDEMMALEKQAAKKPRTTKSNNNDINNNKSPSQKPKAYPKFSPHAPGRRLADGAVVGKQKTSSTVSSSSAARADKPKTNNKTPSLPADKRKHEDISVALLDSLNDKGTMGRILRKGIASQVANAYEMTKASVRLAALESRTPQTSVQMTRIDDQDKLFVRFEKGVQGRGYYQETVDSIPVDVLKQVIAGIHGSNPEGLRPQNLAFLSPRTLWALAYVHWETQQQQQQQQEGPSSWHPFSIEEVYRKLLPDKDWSFLRRRKTNLSAKAQENLRQQQSQENDGNYEDEEEDYEKASDAIQDVEHAMENLQHYDRKQRANRVANAALARQQKQQAEEGHNSNGKDAAWKIVTPAELDMDELKECISVDTTLKNASDITKLANGLVDWASIHNWRELANQHPARLRRCIMEHELGKKVTQPQVENWIRHARELSIEEIIVEICNLNTTHVALLRDKGHAGTPKDLAVWKVMPDLLLEELGSEASTEASLSLDDITQYCNRSSQALEQMEWLAWFATPVE